MIFRLPIPDLKRTLVSRVNIPRLPPNLREHAGLAFTSNSRSAVSQTKTQTLPIKPCLVIDFETLLSKSLVETQESHQLNQHKLAELEVNYLKSLSFFLDEYSNAEWKQMFDHYDQVTASEINIPDVEDLRSFRASNNDFFKQASMSQLAACMSQFEGQGNRGKLVMSLSKAYELPPSTSDVTDEVLRTLQEASLLLDDLGDFASERRGGPPVFRLIGIQKTVMLFNYLLSKALSLSDSLSINIRPFLQELIKGQLLDHELSQGVLALHQEKIEYEVAFAALMRCNELKTAPLFEMIPFLLGIQEKVDPCSFQKLTSFFSLFGYTYQVFDDLNDLEEDSERRRVFENILYLAVIKNNLDQMKKLVSDFKKETKVYAVLLQIYQKQDQQYKKILND